MKSEVVRVDDLVCGGTEHTCTVYLFPPALHRLDNLIFARSHPEVKAVLDWELSTLGDPVSDLAYACIPYHMEPGLPHLKGGKSIASTSAHSCLCLWSILCTYQSHATAYFSVPCHTVQYFTVVKWVYTK